MHNRETDKYCKLFLVSSEIVSKLNSVFFAACQCQGNLVHSIGGLQ